MGGQNARTRKRQAQPDQIEALPLTAGVRSISRHSGVIAPDFDATDDLIHSTQRGRFYHRDNGGSWHLPVYGFPHAPPHGAFALLAACGWLSRSARLCGDTPQWAQLRTSDRDGSGGTLETLQKIIHAIREHDA